MYKFIKIRHDIIKQCHGNYKEMKEFNYKLEIEFFRKSTLKNLGVLRSFKGLGVQKGTQTPCWLRPWTITSLHCKFATINISVQCVLSLCMSKHLG